MQPLWLFWVGFALVAASLAFELANGVARVRGVGTFARRDQAGRYWRWVLLKALVGAVLLAAALGRLG